MTLEELNSELEFLVGQPVTFKRNAANSVIVYFQGEPGDSIVKSFFIDPTWRYERDGKIIIGSFDYQIDESDFSSKEEYQQEWKRRFRLMEALVGTTLLRVEIDKMSADLTLEFSGNQSIRNFANSVYDEDSWTYRDVSKNLKAQVSHQGVKVGFDGNLPFSDRG